MINDIVDDCALDASLLALADPTRRRIVELLQDGPQRAGAIADRLGATRAASSRHLRQLDAAGIVEVTPDPRDARGRVYALRLERLVAVSAWLDQVEAHWTEQQAHLDERRHT